VVKYEAIGNLGICSENVDVW